MMIALLVAAAAACPADQLIGLDLPAWKKSMLADRPGSDEQHSDMAALRMKSVPEGNEGTEGDSGCYGKPVVEGVDVFDAKLTGKGDKLIQVRFRMCKGTPEEWQSLRIAVIVPQPEKKWCLLAGDDPSIDAAANPSCKLPMTLALRELIEKGRNVVETRSCPSGDNPVLQLYRADGWSLARILMAPNANVAYGKTFPKDVHAGDDDYAWKSGKYVSK